MIHRRRQITVDNLPDIFCVELINITESTVVNDCLLKTAGKPWEKYASRPPNLKTLEGVGVIFSNAMNSEKSLLSSRPWLPKLNYTTQDTTLH